MKLRKILLIVVLTFSPMAFASSLQDWQFNVNGTSYFPSKGETFASIPGLSTAAFNQTAGQGTLTLTYKPGAAGAYYVGAYFFDPVGVPFYNEYGTTNGVPASGQTWQIDVPQYDVVSANHGLGTIVDNLSAASLDNANHLVGTTSNYLNDCGANTSGGPATASCSDFVSMALGFKFTLPKAGETETVTLSLSSNNPGGFSLEAIHPVDGANSTAIDLFYSGSAVTGSGPPPPPPPPPGVPEPATWNLMVAAGTVMAGLVLRRRRAAKR